MNFLQRALPLIGLYIFCGACVEPTRPEFQLEEPFYLVEGQITNREGFSEVRVRQSNFREIQLQFDPVREATVFAESAGSQVQWFSEEGSAGVYVPPADFVARAGERWSIRVIFPDGTEAVSIPEVIPANGTLDDIGLVFDPEGLFDEARNRQIPAFHVRIDATDPGGEQQYYEYDYRYWEEITICASCTGGVYRGGRCQTFPGQPVINQRYDYLCEESADGCFRETGSSTFTYVTDRAFEGGSTTDREIGSIPFTQFGGMLVEAAQYSVSLAAYEYGRVVMDLANGAAGLNATIPAVLSGNLSNVDPDGIAILGYFRAASVDARREFLLRDRSFGDPYLGRPSIRLEPSVGSFVPPRAPCRGDGKKPVKPEGWPE